MDRKLIRVAVAILGSVFAAACAVLCAGSEGKRSDGANSVFGSARSAGRALERRFAANCGLEAGLFSGEEMVSGHQWTVYADET